MAFVLFKHKLRTSAQGIQGQMLLQLRMLGLQSQPALTLGDFLKPHHGCITKAMPHCFDTAHSQVRDSLSMELAKTTAMKAAFMVYRRVPHSDAQARPPGVYCTSPPEPVTHDSKNLITCRRQESIQMAVCISRAPEKFWHCDLSEGWMLTSPIELA